VRYRPSYVSRQSGTEKISRVTIATGSTIVVDSSGTCNGERRMAMGKCPRRLWLRRLRKAREHFYGCAFARSVWPETAEHFPRLDAEADVRYGARRSVVLCQLPRLKHTNPAELEPKPTISFNENPRGTWSHSYRNATIGSTRIARMAGTKIAAMAINASNTATQTKLIGS
jgi:hypothetical protein